ncbi:MAG: hypothetical protein SFX72_00005 [Isosphaeraceae bacterium]|nr:hypothetical protein [Isosphaeraceae bacterium]
MNRRALFSHLAGLLGTFVHPLSQAAPDSPDRSSPKTIDPFLTIAFDLPRKRILTFTKAPEVDAYDFETLTRVGSSKLARPIFLTVLDETRNRLVTAAARAGTLDFESSDRAPRGIADLQIFDLGSLTFDGSRSGGAPVAPIATVELGTLLIDAAARLVDRSWLLLEAATPDHAEMRVRRVEIDGGGTGDLATVAPKTTSLVVDPRTGDGYTVAKTDGNRGMIQRIDAATMRVERSLPLPYPPTDLDIVGPGRLVVACRGGFVLFVDGARTMRVTGGFRGTGSEPAVRYLPKPRAIILGDHRPDAGRLITSWELGSENSSSPRRKLGEFRLPSSEKVRLSGTLFLSPDRARIFSRSGRTMAVSSR